MPRSREALSSRDSGREAAMSATSGSSDGRTGEPGSAPRVGPPAGLGVGQMLRVRTIWVIPLVVASIVVAAMAPPRIISMIFGCPRHLCQSPEAAQAALGQIYHMAQQQAAMLAFIDCFKVLMIFVALVFPTVWVLKQTPVGPRPASAAIRAGARP